ncbi:MAG: hypothetical protein HY791_23780 [Deltaproteobacteria bacterium]|nr:hypothetical protein [Deltaproteobacteria bacterium]
MTLVVLNACVPSARFVQLGEDELAVVLAVDDVGRATRHHDSFVSGGDGASFVTTPGERAVALVVTRDELLNARGEPLTSDELEELRIVTAESTDGCRSCAMVGWREAPLVLHSGDRCPVPAFSRPLVDGVPTMSPWIDELRRSLRILVPGPCAPEPREFAGAPVSYELISPASDAEFPQLIVTATSGRALICGEDFALEISSEGTRKELPITLAGPPVAGVELSGAYLVATRTKNPRTTFQLIRGDEVRTISSELADSYFVATGIARLTNGRIAVAGRGSAKPTDIADHYALVAICDLVGMSLECSDIARGTEAILKDSGAKSVALAMNDGSAAFVFDHGRLVEMGRRPKASRDVATDLGLNPANLDVPLAAFLGEALVVAARYRGETFLARSHLAEDGLRPFEVIEPSRGLMSILGFVSTGTVTLIRGQPGLVLDRDARVTGEARSDPLPPFFEQLTQAPPILLRSPDGTVLRTDDLARFAKLYGTDTGLDKAAYVGEEAGGFRVVWNHPAMTRVELDPPRALPPEPIDGIAPEDLVAHAASDPATGDLILVGRDARGGFLRRARSGSPTIALDAMPRCVTVADDGSILVGGDEYRLWKLTSDRVQEIQVDFDDPTTDVTEGAASCGRSPMFTAVAAWGGGGWAAGTCGQLVRIEIPSGRAYGVFIPNTLIGHNDDGQRDTPSFDAILATGPGSVLFAGEESRHYTDVVSVLGVSATQLGLEVSGFEGYSEGRGLDLAPPRRAVALLGQNPEQPVVVASSAYTDAVPGFVDAIGTSNPQNRLYHVPTAAAMSAHGEILIAASSGRIYLGVP